MTKKVFNVIILNRMIMHEEFSRSIKCSYFCLVHNIKDLHIDKLYKKSWPVLYIYNNLKKDFVLMHLSKILGVSKDIDVDLNVII